MSVPDVDLAAWGLPPPSSVRPAAGGTNNTSWILGEDHILRIYRNLDASQVAAEHRLLAALAGLGGPRRLPFAVPSPLPTTTGLTFVATVHGPAALFGYLPGRPIRYGDLGGLELAGEALAALDTALAGLPPALAPRDYRAPDHSLDPTAPRIGALCQALTSALPGEALVDTLPQRAAAAERTYRELLPRLPVQIVHGDLALSNVLVDGGRVSAVLDFEAAGLDLRVSDLTAALVMDVRWGTPVAGAQADALRRGYARQVALEPEEERAIPALLERRRLGSLFHRTGRWQRGLASVGEVRDRLAWLADGTPADG